MGSNWEPLGSVLSTQISYRTWEVPFFQGWLVSGCMRCVLLYSQENLLQAGLRLDSVTGSDCRWIFSEISRWASPWFLTQTFTMKDDYWSWRQFVCSMTSAGVFFLHANISVVLDLAHKWHRRADVGKRSVWAQLPRSPRTVFQLLSCHTVKTRMLCVRQLRFQLQLWPQWGLAQQLS